MTTHENSDGGGTGPDRDEPLCSEEEFAQEVRELVAEEAPHLFALVEEFGERVDGWIVAWGMAFEDHTEVVAEKGVRRRYDSPERAKRAFSRRRTIRLVWANSGPPTHTSELTNAAAFVLDSLRSTGGLSAVEGPPS